MFSKQKFLDDVAQVSDGDYATAFKMLGFIQYVTEAGADRFLSGDLVLSIYARECTICLETA